ncbi:unnamed protein product [Effrenium voratum]|nr:unnamed protein product [Effrenium voratum]
MADTTSHVPTETSGSTAASRKLTRKPTHFSVVDAVRIDAETLRSRRAHWIAETPAKLDCRSRAAVVVDSGWWEIVVTLAICCDLGLTIASFLLSAEEADSFELFLAGGGVLIFLLLDVALRIVKDRLAFFLVALNWIEFVVAMAGLVTVLIEVEERLSAGSTGPKQPGASLGRTIRPVLRVFRVFRGFFTFFASRGGIQGRINKGVDKLFDHLVRKQLVEFLLMPSDNMTIQPSQGILHLEKAQIRSSRLTNMHMPLLLLAGIFDMVHFELKLGKLKVGAHRLMIFMQNVILVLGPGRSEERSADWNYADVKEAKTKTIRLAAKLLEGFAKPRKPNGEAKEGAAASVRREKQAGSSWVRRKMAKLLRDILNNGMQIAIHDFEIRYEDESSGICGPHRIVGGFVVDSLQLRAVSESHGHGDDTHRFRAKGAWRPGLGQNEEDEVQHNSFSWNMKTFSSALLSSRTAMSNMSHRLFDFSHGVHGGLHGHGIKVFWDMFPVDASEASSSDMPAESGTRATSQFRLRLKEESGYNISDFLKTRKGLRMWEGLRYGICSVVMQKLLDERRGAEGVHLSAHRLREKSRRLRDIIGQHKYLVEPFHFTVHFVFRPVKGTGAHPQLDVDLKIQELSTLLDMTQLRGLCAILGYVQTWMRQDTLFQWKPPPAAYRQVSDTGGVGLNRGRMLWAYALRLVLFSIHPKYFWTSLAWIHMRRNACMRQALFEALAARNVDQERVEVLQVSVQAAGGIQVSHAFQGAKLNEEPAMEPSALAGQPPNVAGRGLPRQAASKKTVAEPKESTNLLLSCAAQVAGPTAIIAASMAAEAGRLAAARISAHVPACGQVEKATDNADSPPTRPRRRRSSLSLPAGARAINVPKKTFTEMAEETALSVTIEVLPKGALGLPPPSMLPAWWQELGLVRPDYHIPSR